MVVKEGTDITPVHRERMNKMLRTFMSRTDKDIWDSRSWYIEELEELGGSETKVFSIIDKSKQEEYRVEFHPEKRSWGRYVYEEV